MPTMEIHYVQTVESTVSDTTDETSILTSGSGTTSFVAEYFGTGSLIRGYLGGVLNTAIVAPTIRIRVYLGSVLLVDSSTRSLIALASDRNFGMFFHIVARGFASDAEFFGGGLFLLSAGLTAGDQISQSATTATIDSFSAQDLDVTVQWNNASASNSVTVKQFNMEFGVP